MILKMPILKVGETTWKLQKNFINFEVTDFEFDVKCYFKTETKLFTYFHFVQKLSLFVHDGD